MRRFVRSDGVADADAVEAVLVAGGLGTRMLPLTARRPKHLLPVAGRPFITTSWRSWLRPACDA